MFFFSLKSFPIKELSINSAGTGDGKILVIAAFLTKGSISLPILAWTKKL